MKQILLKLKKARNIIKNSDLKKTGRNEYSKFDYYTPEQVEKLVDNACEETNTIVLCNLKGDENGLFQTLDFIDLESEEKLSFEMRTKHGSITATNETQQMGGTDTYSERYIKMKVFQIKDNNLELDIAKQEDSKIAKVKGEVSKITDIKELRGYYEKNKGLGKEASELITKRSDEIKNDIQLKQKNGNNNV